MSSFEDIGDRFKAYEACTRIYLPRRTYTILRLDGCHFHTVTRHAKRPYDIDLMDSIDEVANKLFRQIANAQIAYAFSDEISLLLTDFATTDTQPWFGGNLQKMCSVSASMAAAAFNWTFWAQMEGIMNATFDCRVFTLSDPYEVENYFIWRQMDCERNSIQMLAQANFSHKELHKKSLSDIHEMLHGIGLNWATQDNRVKRGSFTYRDSIKGVATIPSFHFLDDRELLRSKIPRFE